MEISVTPSPFSIVAEDDLAPGVKLPSTTCNPWDLSVGSAMASPEHAPVDNPSLSHGVAPLEHGALFFLLLLFCGLLSMFWCSFLVSSKFLHLFSLLTPMNAKLMEQAVGIPCGPPTLLLWICCKCKNLFYCSFDHGCHFGQQMSVWELYAFNARRRTLRLHRLKHRNLRFSGGGEICDDTKQLSSKQITTIDGSVRLSRKLSRRASKFGLGPCQQKLYNCQKENTDLKEELSQVYASKSKFAVLLKAEVEKNCSLENELKSCQTQVVTALSDRDRFLAEIEKFQRKEDDLMEKVEELQDRFDQLNLVCTEEKKFCTDLQNKLDKSNQEAGLYRKVVKKFWGVRSQAIEASNCDSFQERAASLLQDDEVLWSFGELNKLTHDECKQARESLVILQVEYQAFRDLFANCQAEIEKESNARNQAEAALLDCRQQLSSLAELVALELRQLNLVKASLKEEVVALLLEEKNWILSLPETFTNFMKEMTSSRCSVNVDEAYEQVPKGTSEGGLKTSYITGASMHKESPMLNEFISQSPKLADVEEMSPIIVKQLEHGEAEDDATGSLNGLILNDVTGSRDLDNYTGFSADDTKEALAQALQEKVAALLLLSQQEERHIVESNTNVALESEISYLKQQLLQVTSEKVEALVELAGAHKELMKLQEQEKAFNQLDRSNLTRSSGRSSSAEGYSILFDNDTNAAFANGVKNAPAQSYLKQLWLKGPDLGARTKSLSYKLTFRSSKEKDPAGIARLRVENATLRESLTSIHHLCKSANRLRLIIARVAAESRSQTESSIEAAVGAVDGVISEALHLKVALHSTLPVDDLGWNNNGSPLARTSEIEGGAGYDANDDLDIVSFLGLEIVRLVLLAAQLQKRFLEQNV